MGKSQDLSTIHNNIASRPLPFTQQIKTHNKLGFTKLDSVLRMIAKVFLIIVVEKRLFFYVVQKYQFLAGKCL